MIIYFSATGNSRYVANQLAADKERIIFIPDAIDQEIYEYNVEPDENVGIISPTYNWTIPSIVEEFLEKLKLNYSTKPYIYYVGTFGTTTGAAAAMANRYMTSKGYSFDAMFDVQMPDTWTPTFDLSDKEHVKKSTTWLMYRFNNYKKPSLIKLPENTCTSQCKRNILSG